jgi:hypothetical protein
MTLDQVKTFTAWARTRIATSTGLTTPSRALAGEYGNLALVLWMCDEVDKKCEVVNALADGRGTPTNKLMRWVGFMQGVMWSLGVASIDELKDANR